MALRWPFEARFGIDKTFNQTQYAVMFFIGCFQYLCYCDCVIARNYVEAEGVARLPEVITRVSCSQVSWSLKCLAVTWTTGHWFLAETWTVVFPLPPELLWVWSNLLSSERWDFLPAGKRRLVSLTTILHLLPRSMYRDILSLASDVTISRL
jgi:hypothetical protein